MHPTMFTLPFLPDWLAEVKSYGVMMMIAFLSSIWLACRRSMRVKGDPDIILNIGFISLICGIVGARAMYVLHYWDTRFATIGPWPAPFIAAFDIRAGGLEFLGGPILTIPAVFIYLKYVAKVSIRWYIDMAIPSLMFGLAITRMGCFLNGCCWGAVCVDSHDADRQRAAVPWAVRFPYGSPAMAQQYKFGQLEIPKELIVVSSLGDSIPLSREAFDALDDEPDDATRKLIDTFNAASRVLREAREASANPAQIAAHRQVVGQALKAMEDSAPMLGAVYKQAELYNLTPDELRDLAGHYTSKPVHPTQLYSVINGFLMAWVLSLVFYYRERHGVVLGVFLLIYPVSRFLLELIRQDNPLDYGGLTISQFLGLTLTLVGVVYLWYIRKLPLKCPLAVPYDPPDDEDPPPARKAAHKPAAK